MMDLISREALKGVLQRYKFGAITNEVEREYTKDTVLDIVAEQPTIDDVPVVKAEWKYYKKQGIAVCTNCSFERNLDDNFGKAVSCPNCGADMRKGGNRK